MMVATERPVRVVVCASPAEQEQLRPVLSEVAAQLAIATDLESCLSCAADGGVDAIVLAPSSPAELTRLLAACAVPVVVAAFHPSVQDAVRSMRLGAHSYVAPGPDLSAALHSIVYSNRPEIVRPRWAESERIVLTRIISRARNMADVLERVRSVARTPATTALIEGESGVGKGLIVEAIHRLSERGSHPLIPVTCSAIPEQLLESELFGHEKGSFTGADADHVGRFEMAEGGTIFLDEIGELPLTMQAKLLRVLEDRMIWRLGSKRARKINVRVVAATHRDLRQMVAEKTFRADLYYRLSVFTIRVPPLRERGADVLHLADHFVEHFNRELGRSVTGLSPAAKAKLVAYDFPGNVRELKNLIEEAIVSSPDGLLEAEHLHLSGGPALSAPPPGPSQGDARLTLRFGANALDNLERDAIELAMQAAMDNQTQAAALLGIQRLALARALTRHGLRRPGHGGRPRKPLADENQ
jgi:DNA-binding NtrC family response regulator